MNIRIFRTTQSDLLKYNGERIVASAPLDESKYDRADVGPMYRIKLQCGASLDAFEDEIIDEEVTQ